MYKNILILLLFSLNVNVSFGQTFGMKTPDFYEKYKSNLQNKLDSDLVKFFLDESGHRELILIVEELKSRKTIDEEK